MKKHWRTMVVFVAVLVVLACLPVIPIRTAPVVPNPVYTLTGISLAGMTWRLGLVGVSYRWEWYTCAVMLALIVLGLAISVCVSKRWSRSSVAPEKDGESKQGGL